MSQSPLGSVSVVIPFFEEEDNVGPLLERLTTVLRGLGRPFEIVAVDDGSRDRTLERLRARLADTPELRVLSLRRNFGQTPALQAGFDHARGDVIVTLDGDGQNDPVDIPRLLGRIEAGADAVSGWRRQRNDTLILRKLPSWLANALIRRLCGVPIHDQGCSLKAYRRRIIDNLNLYSDMHRFLVVLAMPLAASIEEIEVQHHARRTGVSKYGLGRVFKVLSDLAALQLVTRFRAHPARLFLLLGAPFGAGAVAVGAATSVLWSSSVVLPTVAMLLALVALWCLFAGLFAEAILDESARRGGRFAFPRPVPDV